MYFVDANIFLEVALGDKNSISCKELLNNIQTGKVKAVTSDFIIYTCLLQIQHKSTLDNMKKAVRFFQLLEGLMIYRPMFDDLSEAMKIMCTYKLDFDDGLVVSCMESLKIKKLYSFDKHFNGVKSIKRLEP